MAPRARRNQNPTPSPSGGYARLEQNLALLAWLHRQLGYECTRALLKDIGQLNEGFREDGRSHICLHLEARSGQMQGLAVEDLQRYDGNIREHLAAMNEGRAEPITLRYFQYLAALYTEICLDWYTNRGEGLLLSLNRFVSEHNADCAPGQRYDQFTSNDLSKLAFWMATGSGKTLLMHLHYRQFLHYNQEPLDNILLITPREELSQQHLEELQASNIPARRFDSGQPLALMDDWRTVKVTEITKLVMEKQGEGESVAVETFEGRNLIFVDEGHKGSSTEARAWRTVRNALAENGFTFEYSATFGQALAGNDALIAEYGKSIAFDYSYRHFYHDGYGKDFNILNLQEETSSDQTDTLLLANLLSFYEQRLVFAEQEANLRPYRLEKPLWVFVGSSVNTPKKDSDTLRSDILMVVRFLHRVLSDRGWAINTIGQLLQGESGLIQQGTERDILSDKFDYLKQKSSGPEAVYRDVLARVMHTSGGGLQLCDLRGADGELGLKADGSEDYFGVIYIGDTTRFKALVERDNSGIAVIEDALQGSLFNEINEPGSQVEVLAGAHKFIEGWNSWRVSNMGLLNIGRSEGSQIIQLFGRGVRLRGRDMSLKRSSALQDSQHPGYIRLLETLNIFALRANYMAQFRGYLESEGIETGAIKFPLFIRPNTDFLNKGLVIPRLEEDKTFAGQETILLRPEEGVRPVSVTMAATVQQIASGQRGVSETGATSGSSQQIPAESLDLVDWNKAYLDLLEYKETKGLSNLLIQPGLLRPILESGKKTYQLETDESVVNPKDHDDHLRLQEAVTNILRRYADVLYRRRQTRWESNNLAYRRLDHSDDNLQFNVGENENAGQYIVSVPRKKIDLAREIEKLIANCNSLYQEDQETLPRIHFDRHLYQPLLVENDEVSSSPPGLKESERKFVADLRDYCASEPDALPDGTELFLLRNLTRGKGVGFFENSGFFPDFILWVKTKIAQRIVFIEPHGMVNAPAYIHDEKAQLHERLPGLAREIASRTTGPEVQLDSFIVSATKYEDLRKRYENGTWTKDDFEAKHILFPESGDGYRYIAHILHS